MHHQLTTRQVIDEIFLPGADILNTRIARLSALSSDELRYFTAKWKEALTSQRFDLISKMVSLSEEDLTLDFTAVFKLGIEDAEEDIRVMAVDGLEMEDKFIFARPIIKALKSDESLRVRIAAAKALGKFALMAEMEEIPGPIGQDIFNSLLESLENAAEPIELRRRALESIAPFHQEIVESYIEDFYHSDNPKVRASAIYAMGRNCDTRWLSYLIEELQSSNAEIRFEAAQACGEIEDETAVLPLINLLNDKDMEVQEAAISALGKIGGPEAKNALQKLVDNSQPGIRDAARSALAELEACENPLSLNF
jgi:HEAT repeat protein